MKRSFHGLPTIDDEECYRYCMVYAVQCPRCGGRMIEHTCDQLVNSFACATCKRVVSREEMNAIDAASFRGEV